MTEIPPSLMWRISDIGEGYFAGILAANDGNETPDPELSKLLDIPNPQIIYPTLTTMTPRDNLSISSEQVELPTRLMLGSWATNMDFFVARSEYLGRIGLGWGEPEIVPFLDMIAGGEPSPFEEETMRRLIDDDN